MTDVADDTVKLLAELYAGVDRISGAEVGRRAVAADAPPGVAAVIQAVPEGEYSLDEMLDAIDVADSSDEEAALGVEPAALADDDLMREMARLHTSRNATLRHGSDDALAQHTRRTAELEGEYLRRFPQREVDEQRLRSGARKRVRAGARGGPAKRRAG